MKDWPWLHMIGEYTVHNFSTTSEIIGILVVPNSFNRANGSIHHLQYIVYNMDIMR